MTTNSSLSPRAAKALRIAAAAWYTPVLVGQWIFVAFIIRAYGWPLISGDIATNIH